MTRFKLLYTLAALIAAAALVDGTVMVPESSSPDPLRGDCYEDEVIVRVVSAYDGGLPFHFDPGEIVCVPYDDINKGRRPYAGPYENQGG